MTKTAELGNKIKIRREQLGKTQQGISDQLKSIHKRTGLPVAMSKTAIVRLETGLRKEWLTDEQLQALADILILPVSDLIGKGEQVILQYTKEEQSFINDPEAIQYIKDAYAKFQADREAKDAKLNQGFQHELYSGKPLKTI